jgi:hypothetical protein
MQHAYGLEIPQTSRNSAAPSGSVDQAAGARALASLDYALLSLQTDVEAITRLLLPAS